MTELILHIEAWLRNHRMLPCVRNYQPGFAPAAADFKQDCEGCLLIAAHLELSRSAGLKP